MLSERLYGWGWCDLWWLRFGLNRLDASRASSYRVHPLSKLDLFFKKNFRDALAYYVVGAGAGGGAERNKGALYYSTYAMKRRRRYKVSYPVRYLVQNIAHVGQMGHDLE